MVLPNASRFARTAGLGTKLRRRRLACGIFKCAAEVTQNPTLQGLPEGLFGKPVIRPSGLQQRPEN